jgi:hypothetical protein
MHKKKLYY